MFAGVWRETGINSGVWTVTYAAVAPARALVSSDGFAIVTADGHYIFPAYEP